MPITMLCNSGGAMEEGLEETRKLKSIFQYTCCLKLDLF